MDLLDVPSYSRPQADARFSSRHPALRGVPIAVGFRATGLSASLASAQTVQDCLKWSGIVGLDASDLRLVYSNQRTNQYNEGTKPYEDVTPEASQTLRAGLVVNGVTYAMYVNGKRDFVIEPGGWVQTDPLALEVSAGDIITTVTYQAAGTWRVRDSIANPAFGGDHAGITTTGDFTADGATQLANGGGSGIAPAMVTGTPKIRGARTVCLVGASDMEGVGDGFLQNGYNMAIDVLRDGGWGWAVRALRGKTGAIQTARTGDRCDKFLLPLNHRFRMLFASTCTDLISTFGTNDIVTGLASAATLKANKVAEWLIESRRGLRVWSTTLTPYTTSTDNWATLANQTVLGTESVRVAMNDWLRDGAPINSTTLAPVTTGTSPAGTVRMGNALHPCFGLIDNVARAESALNSGKWRVDLVENITGSMTAGSNVLTTSRNLTAADRWKLLQIPAGTAGAMIRGYIATITGANTCTLYSTSAVAVNAVITVAGAAVALDLPTVDGLHGTATIHEQMQLALDTSVVLAA